MNKIKRIEVEKEIKELKELVSKFTRMNNILKSLLEERGYILYDLGTGRSAYSCSLLVIEKNIKSKLYLNGKYVVVGICNHGYKNYGRMYRGYVKKIEE